MLKRCLVLLTGFLAAAGALSARGASGTESPLGRFLSVREASGTFTQRKILADVEVTLVSKGTFRFVKDKSLEWRTLQPIESVFTATPEKYTVSADGKTSERKLSELNLSAGLRALVNGDFAPLESEFDVSFGPASVLPTLKTAKDPGGVKGLRAIGAWQDGTDAAAAAVFVFVPKTKEVRAFVRWFALEGTDCPARFLLAYANGDSLEIDLAQSR